MLPDYFMQITNNKPGYTTNPGNIDPMYILRSRETPASLCLTGSGSQKILILIKNQNTNKKNDSCGKIST